MIAVKNIVIASIAWIVAAAFIPVHAALFITAHPDDVAYLMNKNAQNDVKSNYPTVFVLLTAGDASNGTALAGNTNNTPYYRARLRAYELYVQFWRGLNPSLPVVVPRRSVTFICGKYVETVRMGNVAMYFLNLPDNGSLSQLASAAIESVTSIAPVNRYSLADIKGVIREIIRINNHATPMINLNTQDPDAAWNPGDHADHLATGAIVQEAVGEVAAYGCVNLLYYRGYVVGGYAPSYSDEELNIHMATIGVLNAGLLQNGNRSTWDAFHNNFLGKMDFRGVLGVGNCAF
jgi:LmbE family N-acetylglucosaminyl deacetylase